MTVELRFFEIYRNTEYLLLLAEGILTSAVLTISAGMMGFVLPCLPVPAITVGQCWDNYQQPS
jgi:hypothetical protein